jgi:hypothetical protein
MALKIPCECGADVTFAPNDEVDPVAYCEECGKAYQMKLTRAPLKDK